MPRADSMKMRLGRTSGISAAGGGSVTVATVRNGSKACASGTPNTLRPGKATPSASIPTIEQDQEQDGQRQRLERPVASERDEQPERPAGDAGRGRHAEHVEDLPARDAAQQHAEEEDRRAGQQERDDLQAGSPRACRG